MEKYDIVFIGGGPAGCAGAIRASELGLKTLLIEKNQVGGVCLHSGCIPTKAMLASASLIEKIRRAAAFGLEARLDGPYRLAKIARQREEIVSTLQEGLTQTLQRKGVQVLVGTACFGNHAHLIDVAVQDKEKREIETDAIVIGTGSRPRELSGVPFNGKNILSSDDLLGLTEIPESLGILGGGVIGCEFASFFQALETKVAIVEMMPGLLPAEDRDVSKRLEAIFRRKGMRIFTGQKLDRLATDGNQLSCLLSGGEKFSCEKLVVAVGRRGNWENLNLERLGVKVANGTIQVNEFLETNVQGIYAVGDVIGSPQLAHVAQAEALCIVENLKRKPKAMDYRGWPNVIFTRPEVASAGWTREAAEREGKEVDEPRFLYGGLGKSHVERETDGLIKLIFDRKTREILGGHIMGDYASELIAEISLAIRLRAKREDLVSTMHAHPTYSEIIWECARSASDNS